MNVYRKRMELLAITMLPLGATAAYTLGNPRFSLHLLFFNTIYIKYVIMMYIRFHTVFFYGC